MVEGGSSAASVSLSGSDVWSESGGKITAGGGETGPLEGGVRWGEVPQLVFKRPQLRLIQASKRGTLRIEPFRWAGV